MQSLTPYKTWIKENNIDGVLSDDLDATSGKNGNSNLVNYAFLNDPDSPLNLIQVLENSNNEAYASITLPYPLRSNLRYRIQKTSSLTLDWTTIATLEKGSETWSFLTGEIIQGNSQIDTTILETTPTNDTKYFWRFNIEE